MRGLKNAADPGALEPLARKLIKLGAEPGKGLRSLLQCVARGKCGSRGSDIVRLADRSAHSTVLLDGVACLYRLLENGQRQISSFYYAGDFCDLQSYAMSGREQAVVALADCSIGRILYGDLDLAI